MFARYNGNTWNGRPWATQTTSGSASGGYNSSTYNGVPWPDASPGGPSGGGFVIQGMGTTLLLAQGYGTPPSPPSVVYSYPVVVGRARPVGVSPARSYVTAY